MLLVKLHDNTFSLGGRGTQVEFCFLCHALRVFCSFHLFYGLKVTEELGFLRLQLWEIEHSSPAAFKGTKHQPVV